MSGRGFVVVVVPALYLLFGHQRVHLGVGDEELTEGDAA